MTEVYYGAEAEALDAVAGWIAGTAIAATIGWTRATLVEGESDSATPPTTAYGLMEVSDLDLERDSADSFQGTVTVDVDLLWPPYAGIASKTEARRRALGDFARLRRQAAAAAGVVLTAINGTPPIRLDLSSDPGGWWTASLSFVVRVRE